MQPAPTGCSGREGGEIFGHRTCSFNCPLDMVGTAEPHQCCVTCHADDIATKPQATAQQLSEAPGHHLVQDFDAFRTGSHQQFGESGEPGQICQDRRADQLLAVGQCPVG